MPRRIVGSPKPLRIGLIIHRAPSAGDHMENMLRIADECLKTGCQVDVFALSDGVWLARMKWSKRIQTVLRNIVHRGGRIIVSESHLKAAGVGSKLPTGWMKLDGDPYWRLAGLVMDEWDRVIVI
ncbi:MAG: hypothetical protein ACE5PO_02180 [Candidatus Bathyarchaeia archaeon]